MSEQILFTHSRTELAASDKSAMGPERINQRNGYRDRLWETRAGTLELRIPKLRKGGYFPGLLEPRRLTEKALSAALPAHSRWLRTR